MKLGIAFVLFSLIVCSVSVAEELERVPEEQAKSIGGRLAKLTAKIEKPQIKIEPDAEKANGMHVVGKLGMLILPQKDLKESEELAARFKDELGAPLAMLFTYKVAPVVKDKLIDKKHLRTMKVTDGQGNERSAYVYLLSVRQLSDDDYRLYVYGADKKPIVDARFSEGTGPGPEPVAIEVKNGDDEKQQGDIAITVFGKYQAKFRAGYVGD